MNRRPLLQLKVSITYRGRHLFMNTISPERWNRIDALFAEALDVPTEEQQSYLEAACGHDHDLYERVLSLLESDLEAERILGESATEYVTPLLPGLRARWESEDRDDLPENGRIGPYKVLHEVGRGGMGRVYMAERDDEHFRKRVALKLVKRGMDSDEILRRFRYERQILASLEHPNIAALYDGGITDDGRPYLVMEYVGGRTIDRYCDDEELSIDERLELFGSVCEAVRYAHRSLVVHRDLKPSNILVTDEGTVKLLDFGIAKLLSDGGSSSAPSTRTGMHVMTPEYASPEQLRGETVTTASDAYSLGVVLYELLTGHRPFEPAGPTRTGAQQSVQQREPELPSSAVTRGGARRRRDGSTVPVTPESVSAARRTSTERLQRRLRGDLDTILLMALGTEPQRRYPSAEAFLDDIKRHLAGLPVRARKETTAYRVMKFVRRHRFGVAAAAVFVLLVSASATALVLQQADTARQRDRAQMEADKAREITSFMVDLFRGSDPNAAAGDTLTALQLLDSGAERVDAELAGRPEVRAAVLHVLGTLYTERAAYGHADSLLQQAVGLWKSLHAGAHPETIESLRELAIVRLRTGRFDGADSLLQEAMAMSAALSEPDPLLAAQVEHDRAVFLLNQGRYDEAEPLYRSALNARVTLLGEDHGLVSESLEGLADLTSGRGAPAEAEPLLRRVLEIRERLHGEVHTEVADALNKLGGVLVQMERFDDAEQAWRRSLEVRRTLLGPDHPAVAQALVHLGYAYMETGRLEEAEVLHRDGLAIFERTFGAEHTQTIATMNNLAFVIDRLGRSEEAELMYRRVVEGMERLLGPDHPNVASGLQNVAVLRQRAGDLEEAEALYRRAVTIREQRLGLSSTFTATTQHSYALLLLERGDCGTAEPLFRQALGVFEKEYEAGHSRIAFSQGGLGACLTMLERHEEAESLLQSSFLALRSARGVQDAGTQQAARRLSSLYSAWDRPEEAAEYQAMLPIAED